MEPKHRTGLQRPKSDQAVGRIRVILNGVKNLRKILRQAQEDKEKALEGTQHRLTIESWIEAKVSIYDSAVKAETQAPHLEN